MQAAWAMTRLAPDVGDRLAPGFNSRVGRGAEAADNLGVTLGAGIGAGELRTRHLWGHEDGARSRARERDGGSHRRSEGHTESLQKLAALAWGWLGMQVHRVNLLIHG